MTAPALWGPTFGADSWAAWRTFVAATCGLPVDDLALFQRCTGREAAPDRPARVIAAICGRRSGKSLVAAFLAVAHGILSRPTLAPGERPVVLCIATDKRQAGIIHGYVAGLLEASPLTAREIVARTADRIELRSGVSIEVRASDFKKVRGLTCLAAVVDESAFLRSEESSTPDLELFRALRPSLATSAGPFITISSPWARRGLLFNLWRKHWGKDKSDTLVWVADSRTMNATLPASVVDEAMADDPIAARSEWLAGWREDVQPFLSEAALDAVTADRTGDLAPVPGVTYRGFLDPSGGSQDAFALAIAHAEQRDGQPVAVVDVVTEVRPPFNAEDVVARYAETLKAYRVSKATADKYAGVWVVDAFARHGIVVEQSAAPKSELYCGLLPLTTARRVELPEHRKLLTQLAQLERRSRAGGRDVVDHPPGAHDDLANVVAGACVAAAVPAGTGTIAARGLGEPRRLGLSLMPGHEGIADVSYQTEALALRTRARPFPEWD